MYTLILQRLFEVKNVKKQDKKDEPATVGILTLYWKGNVLFRSCTIENGGESSTVANQDKRIMPDLYGLRYSKTTVPLPKELNGLGILLTHCSKSRHAKPDFEKRRIFIHNGNYPQDTEGCILLNSVYDFVKNEGVGQSSNYAVKTFYDIIKTKKIDIKKLLLLIRDPLK